MVPKNTHYVPKCVKFYQLSRAANHALFGVVKSVNGSIVNSFEIQEGKCLDKGYKFNQLFVVSVPKEHLKKNDSIDWKNDKSVIWSTEALETQGTYLDNSNSLKEEEILYEVTGVTGNKVNFIQTLHTKKFSDGKVITDTISAPSTVEKKVSSESSQPNYKTETIKKKKCFWCRIGCGFKKMFGKECN